MQIDDSFSPTVSTGSQPSPVLQPDPNLGVTETDTQQQLDTLGSPSLSDSFFAGLKQYQFADVKGAMVYAGKKYLASKNPDYSPFTDDSIKSKGEDFISRYGTELAKSESPEETYYLLQSIDEFEKANKEIEANPFTGTMGRVVGQLTSPTSFMFPSILKMSTLAKIATVSGVGGAQTAAIEAGRAQYDPTLTFDEAGSNVMGAMVFGGVLTGLGSAIPPLARGAKNVYSNIFGGVPDMSAEGANVVASMNKAIMEVGNGTPVENVLRDYKIAKSNFLFNSANKISSFLNPESRLLNSGNQAVREEAARLIPTNLIFEHNLKGMANEVNVMEKARFRATNDAIKMRNSFDTEFAQYKKDGGKLKFNEFVSEVNDHVMGIVESKNSRVINNARHVTEKLNDYLVKLKAGGFLPEDWMPKQKYFPTRYNFEKLTKNRFTVLRDLEDEIRASESGLGIDDIKQAAKDIYNNLIDSSQGKIYNRKEYKSPNLEKRVLDLSNKFRANYSTKDLIGTMDEYFTTVNKQLTLKETYGTNDFYKAIKDRASKGLDDMLTKIEKDSSLTDVQKNAAAAKLQKHHESDLKDLLDVFELQTGQYHQKFSKAGRSAAALIKGYQTMRVMGGQVLSNLPDIASMMHLSVKGSKTEKMLKDLTGQMSRSFKLFKDKDELRLLGLMSERNANASRSVLYANLDGASQMTKWESRMSKATAFYSRNVSGFDRWNDWLLNTATESLSKRLFQWSYQLTKGTLKEGSSGSIELARMGINKDLAGKIVEQFQKHSSIEKYHGGKVTLANIDDWDAEVLSEVAGVIRDEVQKLVFSPRAGARPLWVSSPFGSVIAQFQGFALGAWQGIVLPRLQKMSGISGAHTTVAVSSLVADLMLGTVSGYIKDGIRTGDWEAPDPEQAIQYAFDRSAFLSIFSYGSGAMDAMFKKGLGNFLNSAKYSKYREKTAPEVVGGITASTLIQMQDALGRVSDGNISDADMKLLLQFLPAQNSYMALTTAKLLGDN